MGDESHHILGPDGRPIPRSELPGVRSFGKGWKLFLAVGAGVTVTTTLIVNIKTIRDVLFPSTDVAAIVDATKEATTGTTDRRIAGISRLGGLWDRAGDPELKNMADTLTRLLRSDSEQIGLEAAKSIGRAYTESTASSRQEKVKRLLYGSTRDKSEGVVAKLNRDLQKEPARFVQLIATREAIRQNWENLRDTQLEHTSLIAARLYEAKLQGAYLRGADLRCADLRGADLTGANVEGVKWQSANVLGLIPSSIRAEAISKGALTVEKDAWTLPPECQELVAGR
jgi:Pentapeptide repeats (8 copies)